MRPIDADSLEIELLCTSDSGWEVWGVSEENIKNTPTITPPPNDPLTLEELREMDGEPVWIAFLLGTDGECLAMWALVSVDKEYNEIFLMNSICGSSSYEEVWADIKAIYRRKPEDWQNA